jgi:deoxycytidine triphosphate deaminase
MLLSDQEIKNRRLVENRIEAHFRAASYDLSVGTIISVEGKEEEGEYWLKPQGIVEIISRERVKLPKDVVGYVMVKTSLCNQGILALNIGIVDPGYEGFLSTTLLNFGKNKFLLRINDVFLRLTFLDCYISPRSNRPSPVGYRDYVRGKREKMENFPETFLNLEATVQEASEPLFEDLKKKLIFWVPVGAFALALFAFLVTLGVNYTSRNIWSREQLKAELLSTVHHEKLSKFA